MVRKKKRAAWALALGGLALCSAIPAMADLTPAVPVFRINDDSGKTIAYFDDEGNFATEGTVFVNAKAGQLAPTGEQEFLVYDATQSEYVMRVDSTTGDVFLKGDIIACEIEPAAGVCSSFVPASGGTNNLVVEDATGTVVSWVDDEGEMYLSGMYIQNQKMAFGVIPGTGTPNTIYLNSNATTDSGGQDFLPDIASDGNGTWVAVWEAVEQSGGSDYDIYSATSVDNGYSWSAPVVVSLNAAEDRNPRIATNGDPMDLEWMVVWESNSTSPGSVGSDKDIFTSLSTTAGATWSAPVVIDNAGYLDLEPQVASNGDDDWLVTWYSYGVNGSDYDIYVSHSDDDGATWDTAVSVNHFAGTDTWRDSDERPTIATALVGATRTWMVVWESTYDLDAVADDDYDIFFSASVDFGASWSDAELVNGSQVTEHWDDIQAEVASDGTGTWIVAWEGIDINSVIDESDVFYAVSTNVGASWSGTDYLNTDGATDVGDQREPHIASDGDGNWVAVWHGDNGGTYADPDISMANSSDDGATWSEPLVFNPNASYTANNAGSGIDYDARVTADGNGNWVAVWYSVESYEGTGTDYDIFKNPFEFP